MRGLGVSFSVDAVAAATKPKRFVDNDNPVLQITITCFLSAPYRAITNELLHGNKPAAAIGVDSGLPPSTVEFRPNSDRPIEEE